MLLLAKMQGMLAWRNGSVPKVLSYQTSALSTSDTTTYTFTSQAIGAAAASRLVIVGISVFGSAAGRTLTSCTIGGITATQIVFQEHTGTQPTIAIIVAALVPTGTTATVVVTMSGLCYACGIGIWSSPGFSATTAYDTGSSTSVPGSDTVNILNGGFVIAVNAEYNTSAVRTTSWTNATERYDAEIDTRTMHSGADYSVTADGTRTITSTWSGTTTNQALVMASW